MPLKIAYDDPELKRVALAAQQAGYEVFLESKKNYSKTWYQGNGRIRVKKEGSKEEQLRTIAKEIHKVSLPKPKAKTPSKKKPKKGVYREKKR